jgi:hypothetical protein
MPVYILGCIMVIRLYLLEFEIHKVVGIEWALLLHLLRGYLGARAVDVDICGKASDTLREPLVVYAVLYSNVIYLHRQE